MNEKERYEERDQPFNDLPVPDSDQSWQKMQQLLDKDDDNGRVLPPILLRSCLGWGAILLIGLTAAWLIVRPERWRSKADTAKQPSSSVHASTGVHPSQPTATTPEKTTPLSESKETANRDPLQQGQAQHPNTSSNPVNSKVASKEVPILRQSGATHNTSISGSMVVQKKQSSTVRQADKKDRTASGKPGASTIGAIKGKDRPETKKETTGAVNNPVTENHPANSTEAPVNGKPDVTKETGKQDSTASQPKPADKKADLKKKQFFIAAGIGEQQQIPIAGQTAVPYSHYGRKGSLADYIPSVFVRLQKEQKWYVQAEFRYGGAQSVREFSYNQQTKFDTGSNSIQTTTLRLKKTYYHQLPVSFNYFLTPHLSVGIGGIYSRFYGAVTEQETVSQNVQTQAVTVFKQIVPIKHFTDSFLYKTQVHALLQADYQWRQFTFGLRYTKDIQPYIKYTNPDGTIDERKNQSLQFLVRYQFWKSKRF